ncbi:hypothetical protein B2J96_15240 [Mycobacterium shigaense]|nr:hypothetical protein B2J96_15240 [Mycobacterium shigaense]
MNIMGAVHRRCIIAALAAIAILSGSATPVAHATGTDDFLGQVRADGIGDGASDDAIIEDAKEVCDLLTYQQSAYPYLAQYAGLGPRHSAKFIADAATYFCPQYAPGDGPPRPSPSR